MLALSFMLRVNEPVATSTAVAAYLGPPWNHKGEPLGVAGSKPTDIITQIELGELAMKFGSVSSEDLPYRDILHKLPRGELSLHYKVWKLLIAMHRHDEALASYRSTCSSVCDPSIASYHACVRTSATLGASRVPLKLKVDSPAPESPTVAHSSKASTANGVRAASSRHSTPEGEIGEGASHTSLHTTSHATPHMMPLLSPQLLPQRAPYAAIPHVVELPQPQEVAQEALTSIAPHLHPHRAFLAFNPTLAKLPRRGLSSSILSSTLSHRTSSTR